MASRIRIRRGTTTQWNSSTKILESAEIGLDSTLNKLKIGDGINLWSALPFINVLPSELSELAQDAVESAITAGTGITKNYNDTANTITLAVDSTIANKTYVDTAVSGLGSTSATTYVPLSVVGNADGVASLDETGKIPDSEIPAGITRDTELSSAISTEVTDRNTAITTAITNLIDGSPAALDTLNELAAAINDDSSYAATITTALGTKAPIASPTFTGTVGGITKDMVGLSNVDNTSDSTKALITYIPVSSATRTISSATDKNTLIECSVACTITIPNDTQDAGWPIGSMVEVRQTGTGQVTITKDAAVTMVGTDSQFKSRVQWSTIMLEKRAANSWLITGDTTA
jgi:hypothetical protein